MKKLLCLALTLIIALVLLAYAPREALESSRPAYAPDLVKIKLSAGAMERTSLPTGLYAESLTFNLNELDQLFTRNGGTKIIRAHRQVNDTAWQTQTGFDRWFLIKLDGSTSVEEAIRSFKANRYVEDAIPEYYAYTTAVPNDTYYANNWGHNNTAQLPVYQSGSHSGPGVGTVGFDSDAQHAWDQSQGYGSASIIIAVIDTGVDTAHPDLRLVAGYDYGDNDANPMDNSADPGHGTSCSGVAAAIANNGLGVAGIGAGCSVMPLKIADSAGSLGFTAIENALTHCGDHNVDVASMSFGAPGMNPGDSPSTDAAVAYAYNHGVALFAATANGNTSAIDYPSNHANVIAVGAASPTGQRKSTTSSDGENWWGSNYGVATMDAANAVDIMAPTILPTTDITGAGNGYNTSSDYYMWFNGTSCATPYAAGVAGLILSKAPTLTPAQLRTVITSTCTDMTIDGGAGWDRYTGYGMVNANNALTSLVPGMPSCSITSPANGSTHNINSTITVNVTATDDAKSITQVQFFIDDSPTASYTDYSAPYTWSWDTTGYSAGAHSIKAVATDNDTNTAQSQISVTLLAPADEGFETGNFSAYPWVNNSAIPWTVQSTQQYSGTYAAKSGAIGNSATTTLSVSMNVTSAGTISFYYKVSSESGFDYLRFYIDGVQQTQWSGEAGWALQSYAVAAGARTFAWTYYKDSSAVGGSDCAWLDHINFPPNNPPAQITWNPATMTQDVAPEGTASQNLTIGNTGGEALNYTVSKPIGGSTILDEGFENGGAIPAGWTQEYVSGTVAWAFATGGYNGTNPSAAYEGTYNARLFFNSSSTPYTTKLVSPSLDIAGASSASLSFYHTQAYWSGDQDQLKVYYKTSSGGSWTQLAHYTASVTAWTQRTISLPNPSGTYYIAFEGITDYGYGVCVDKVVVTAEGLASNDWLTINGGASANGTINVSGANQTVVIGFNATGLGEGTYNSSLIITSNSGSNPIVNIPVTMNVFDIPTPVIVVNPLSLSYGTLLVGSNSTQNFTIQNTGTATLSGNIITPAGYSVALSGGKSAPLGTMREASANNRNTLPYTVNQGNTSTFIVTFAPPAAGSYNGDITISHNAGGADKTINLTGTGITPVPVPFAEGFEDGLGNWQLVNGSQTNIWALGTATAHTGDNSLYISNDAGTSNTYNVNTTSLVHAYRNISFPAGEETYKLRFAWKGQGEGSSTFYDYLRVYLVDSNVTPEAGTAIGSGQLGGTYNLVADWQEETMDIPAGVNGQNKRLVFSWRNDSSLGTQPPAAIDNIRIVEGSQSDAAVIIDNSVVITPPPVTDPESNPIAPSVEITGLTDTSNFITVISGYNSVGSPAIDAGLDLVFTGVSFTGATLSIAHNLGFVPYQLSYRIGDAGSWHYYPNPGGWTSSQASFPVPAGGKGEDDVFISFADSDEETLPVTLSSFTATISGVHYVALNWITATETGVMGYYIYRAEAEAVNEAEKVSPLILGTNTSTQQSYLFVDQETEPSTTYFYWLEGVDLDGASALFGPISISTLGSPDSPNPPVIPMITELIGNHPNPFNPNTTLRYSLKEPGTVNFSIWNSRGQLVNRFTREHTSPGYYSLPFNGRDVNGNDLASGVYFCRMQVGANTFNHKLLMMK